MEASLRHQIDAALAAQDEQAFSSLLDRYYGPMLRLAKAIVSDDASATAGVRRAWQVALRSDAPADQFSSLAAWLFSLVKMELEGDATARDWEPGGDTDPGLFEPEDDRWAGHWRDEPVPWPESAPAARAAAMQEHLRELPSLHAALLVLHDAEGMDGLAITAVLDLPHETQLAVLHSARTMLRRAIDRRISSSTTPS